MEKIKVGILAKPIEDGKSGSGSHLENLLNYVFCSKSAEAIDFTLIHYQKSDKDVFKKAKDVIISKNPIVASRQVNELKLDVVHYSPLTIFSPICVKAKKTATLHGDMQHFLPNQYSLIDRLHKKYVVRNYSKFMDHVFTVSETSKTFLVDEYNLSKEDISVVFNGVSNHFREIEEDKIANFLSKKNIRQPYIFHLSKFSERKNPWCLIDAFAKSAEENRDLELLVGGFGWDNNEVKKRIEALGVADRVKLLGFISLDDIVHYLNGASMFVFPSFYEGFGMPNLEAMKCGCPVITTNLFAIPEIVGEGALLLNDPNDSTKLANMMNDLLDNNDLRADLVKKGYSNVKRFNWEESAARTIAAYKALAKN